MDPGARLEPLLRTIVPRKWMVSIRLSEGGVPRPVNVSTTVFELLVTDVVDRFPAGMF